MKLKPIILIASLLSTSALFAQGFIFKTLASKGACIIQRGDNPDEYTPAKTGVQIFEEDKIIITGNQSYLGLVTEEGRTLELKKGGVYSVKELKEILGQAKDSNLAEKYMQFLINDMAKVDESTSANMELTGSVSRSKPDPISLFYPKSSKILNLNATLSWVSKAPSPEYEVTVSNMFDEVVMKQASEQEMVNLDLSALSFEAEEAYKIYVSTKGSKSKEKSNEISIVYPTDDEFEKVNKDLDVLMKGNLSDSALDNLVIGKYLEENGYYLNAIHYFEKAIELEPGVAEYQKLYDQFLYSMNQDK